MIGTGCWWRRAENGCRSHFAAVSAHWADERRNADNGGGGGAGDGGVCVSSVGIEFNR
jgi:hypothetical protein